MAIVANGKEYEPTADDKLWLLRAVQAEGAPQKAVAQTLVNLFAWGLAHGSKQTLAQLVRAYAQPVNPRWMPGGDKFEAWKVNVSGAEADSAARRRRLASQRTVFDRATHKAVREALTVGLRDVHRSATDYAAPTLDATKKGYKPLTDKETGRNRFWTRDASWGGYAVRLQEAVPPAVGAVALLAIALVTWRVLA